MIVPIMLWLDDCRLLWLIRRMGKSNIVENKTGSGVRLSCLRFLNCRVTWVEYDRLKGELFVGGSKKEQSL